MREHPSIAMTSEFVHAWLSPDSVRVECVFFLANKGPAASVLIGFPCTSSGVDTDHATPFRWFRSWVDGKQVATRTVIDTTSSSGDEWSRLWEVKEVTFGRDQVRCIRELYTAAPGSSVPDWRSFEYELDTGATWLGPIGTADIVVTLLGMSGMSLEQVSPATTGRGGDELRWHFSNFEPSHLDSTGSIDIFWHPRLRGRRER